MKLQVCIFTSLASVSVGFVGCAGDAAEPVRKFKVGLGSGVSPGMDAEAIRRKEEEQEKLRKAAEKSNNKPPILNALPPVQVKAGFSFSVAPQANDPEGEALSYFLNCPSELGGTAESDNAFFSVTVAAGMGTQTATCAVFVREKGQYLQQSQTQQFQVFITVDPATVPKGPSVAGTLIQAVAPQLCENLTGWAKTICDITGTVAGGLIK